MPHNIQHPVTVEQNDRFGSGKSTTTTHPAFGQIVVSKPQGAVELYGSDFTHHSFVNITVHESELTRNLSRDWPFARKQLLSLSMSESQWATFVSSFGVGGGTQCTLEYVDGERLPSLPPRKTFSLYSDEAQASFKEAVDGVEKLKAIIQQAASKLPKKTQAELLGPIESVISMLASTLPFVKKSFDEHIEEGVEKAKAEVHAYATNTLLRAGLSALTTQGEAQQQISKSEDLP